MFTVDTDNDSRSAPSALRSLTHSVAQYQHGTTLSLMRIGEAERVARSGTYYNIVVPHWGDITIALYDICLQKFMV